MKQSGQILVLTLIAMSLILVNTLVIISNSVGFSNNSGYNLEADQALNLAEAGVDKALASLNATGGSYSGDGETVFGSGTFTVSVTTVNNNMKLIESTGFLPSKAKSKARRTIKVNVAKGAGVAFNYGLQVGEGGITMSQNSQVNGSVYSNGNISMQNNSKITGDAYAAGGSGLSLDQQTDCSSCGDFIFGTLVSGQNILDVGQSFTTSTTNNLYKVSLKLKKYGAPPDVTVRILGDKSGSPDKNNVLASGTLSANLVSSSYSFVDVTFNQTPVLTSGATYWLMIDTSQNNTNYWAWSDDNLQSYSNGFPSWSPDWQASHQVWTNVNYDFGFKLYLQGIGSISGSGGNIIGGNAYSHSLSNLAISKSAYYQTIQNTTAANYFPNSADPSPQVLPISSANIQEWQTDAAANGLINGDVTGCPSLLLSGKYTGSFTPSNGCTITVDSPIWFTGNATLGNNVTLNLNPVYGAASGVFMVDGQVSLGNGNKVQGSGTSGSYLFMISNFDSKDDPDSRDAITFLNQANSGIVYTNLGSVNVANNNNLTTATGWKLVLGNGAIVSYDQGLAGSFFTSGPSGSYSIIKGTYQIK